MLPREYTESNDKKKVASKRQKALLNDKCHTGSLHIQRNWCPGSAFCSLIIPETQAKTKTTHLHSGLLQRKNEDDDDDDLENNDAKIRKKT